MTGIQAKLVKHEVFSETHGFLFSSSFRGASSSSSRVSCAKSRRRPPPLIWLFAPRLCSCRWAFARCWPLFFFHFLRLPRNVLRFQRCEPFFFFVKPTNLRPSFSTNNKVILEQRPKVFWKKVYFYPFQALVSILDECV
uniref:Uncharacterized protein n=1 Tax=Phlegmariurus squarrosus TaxID=73615 RepID=H9M8B4_PHLSQ|nr:hypothetical protein HusqMp35 [Phlegmariurus squarrosus]AEV55821.1 hypothetical protein HusqMp35 [Phlegmariurus squarrosus]